MAASSDLSATLCDAIVDVVADLDVELVEVTVKGPRNKRIVKLVADTTADDEALDVDRIAQVSRAIGDIADDVVDGSYTLEVTSPGVDRPLTTPRHFRRNLGRAVEVRHASGDTDTQTTGTIDDVDEDAVTLTADDETVVIPFDEVFEGRIVLPW